MRDRSPVETLLTWASFGAASIAIHLLVVFGGRPQPPAEAGAPRLPQLPAASGPAASGPVEGGASAEEAAAPAHPAPRARPERPS